MSDQTNQGGAGDFRGSAADKRKDETVMVNADDLSNLVSSARQEPAPVGPPPDQPVAPQHQPPAAIPASASKGLPVAVIAAGLGIVALIIVVALLVFLGGK